MGIVEFILIGFSLAMDSFSVTIAKTIVNPNVSKMKLMLMPVLFGFFQGLMPLIGGLLITNFKQYVEVIDHWIAFVLLLYIGINLIREARSEEDIGVSLNLRELLILAIATSIDALSVGISFAVSNSNVWLGSLISGVVTFFVCIIGIYIGDNTGRYLKSRAGYAGGIILILIGFRILIEHLFFGA